MKKRAVAGIFLALTCAGCLNTGQLSRDVDIQAPLPAGIRSVVIQAVPMKPGAVKNVEGLADAHRLFVGYVKDALAPRQPGWQIELADERAPVPGRDLVIRTELLEVDGGSAALRFWIGLETGATQSRVRVSIADQTGRDLVTTEISERTVCPVGACTDSNDAMVQRNLQGLAGDVAEFIVDPAGYKKSHEPGS